MPPQTQQPTPQATPQFNLQNLPPDFLSNLQQILGNISKLLPQVGQPGQPPATPPATTSPSVPVISSQALSPQQPVDLSGFSFPSQVPGLQGQFAALIESRREESRIAREREEREAKRVASGEGRFRDVASEILEIEGRRGAEEEAAGIPKASQELDAVTSQIEAKQLALTRELEEIRKTPGLSLRQIEKRVNEASRLGNMELADLSIIQSSKSRQLTTAQATIDRKIKLQLEPLERQLQFEKFFLDRADAVLSSAEKKALKARTDEEDLIIGWAKDELKAIYELATTAGANGADTFLIQQIMQSGSRAEAAALARDYVGADLTGTSADLRTFAALRPDLKVGTPQFQQAFNQFVAQQAGLKREPKTEPQFGFKLSNSDRGKLLGAGIPPASVTAIEQYLALYGFDDTLKQSLGANANLVGSILSGSGAGFNFEDL